MVLCRLRVKMKQVESSQHDAPDDNVDASVRTSSLSTFERLQEDIIELEATQRRLQEDIIELEASHRDDSRRTS